MKEQPDKIKIPGKTKKARGLYVILSLIIFSAAVFAVSEVAFKQQANKQQAKPLQPAKVAIVEITATGFKPNTLSVEQGTEVVWTNNDNSLHQVASNPYPKDTGLKSLKSEILNNDQSYEYAANSIGTFGYHDQLKPTINGTLVVHKR